MTELHFTQEQLEAILDFFSGELAKLHSVYHDNMAANFKP